MFTELQDMEQKPASNTHSALIPSSVLYMDNKYCNKLTDHSSDDRGTK